MHPMLVDQLNEFEGHLNAQIHTAYENDPQNVNPYLPIASTGYHESFGQHPSSANYHQPQPQLQPQGIQYSHSNTSITSHTSHTSHASYHQPTYDSQTAPYDYSPDYQGTIQYSEPVQGQHWSSERPFLGHESYSNEKIPVQAYSNPQHPPAHVADQHSLQQTWSSFVYTVGSPPPFAMD